LNVCSCLGSFNEIQLTIYLAGITIETATNAAPNSTQELIVDPGTDEALGGANIGATATEDDEVTEQQGNPDAGADGSELQRGKFGYIADVLGLTFAILFFGLFCQGYHREFHFTDAIC
jgi:hypothetical protein